MTGRQPAHPIHFVGSIPLADADSVFRALAASVGARARRWPDGETGNRTNWIRWQKATFDAAPGLVLKSETGALTAIKDAVDRPVYLIRDGVDPADIAIGSMGYAAEAAKSYAVFAALKQGGVIPAAVRFQVSIPSAVALTAGFFDMAERAAVEPAIEAALAREVETIAAAIPHDQVAIQWDVCLEVVWRSCSAASHMVIAAPLKDRPVDRDDGRLPTPAPSPQGGCGSTHQPLELLEPP